MTTITVRELGPRHWQVVDGNRWWTVDGARLGLPRIVNMAGKLIRPESDLGRKLLDLVKKHDSDTERTR